MAVEKNHQETRRIEDTEAFLRGTDLLKRFGSSMGQAQVGLIKSDYDTYGKVDSDILCSGRKKQARFSFHAVRVDL